jgi:AMMECR1 domain-containing protein
MVAVPTAPALESLAEASRRWLLYVARHSLRAAMAQREPAALDLPLGTADRPNDPRLDVRAPVYVSWHDGAELVGSLGRIEPWLPLEQAVARYAAHAGLDARAPATRARWHRLSVEVSVLGLPQELPVAGFTAICESLAVGRDGVLLPRHHAVALPSVWRQHPRPRDFMLALMRKVGLSPEHDGARLRARTFLAETFAEPTVDRPRRGLSDVHLPLGAQLH